MSLKRSEPFLGAYNRCYVNKKGEFKRLYTSDVSYGTTPGLTQFHTAFIVFFAIAFIVAIPMVIGDFKHGFINITRIVEILVIGYFLIFRWIKLMVNDIKTHIEAYNYFKENPRKLDNTQMIVHDICPICGTQNNKHTSCANCGENLELKDNSINK